MPTFNCWLCWSVLLLLCGHDTTCWAQDHRLTTVEDTTIIDSTPTGICNQIAPQHRFSFEALPRTGWKLIQAPEDWMTKPLQRVILHCALDQCQTLSGRETILRAMNLPMYQPLTEQSLLAGWQRLMQTGLFEHDSFAVMTQHPRDQSATLEICTQVAPIIESIEVTYSSWASIFYPRQFLTEIDKRLTLKRGGFFPSSPSDLRRQEHQIERSYERLGYQNVHVHIRPVFLDKKKQRVAVKILVNEGARPQLRAPLIEFSEPITDVTIREGMIARVTQAVTPDLFFDVFQSFFSIFGIGRYDRKATRQRVEDFERQLREEGWVSARVRVVEDQIYGGQVSPLIQLRYGPKLTPIFIGNQSVSSEQLTQDLTFIESGVIDEVELEASRKKMISRYQSASFYYVKINATLRRLSDQSIEARFNIDEGPSVYIKELIARGVSPKLRKELETILLTKGVAPDGVLPTFGATAGILQETTLNQDLARLLARYDMLGYSSAVLRCAPHRRYIEYDPNVSAQSHRYDIWTRDLKRHRCFRVIPDHPSRDQRHLLTVIFEVNEGKKTSLNFVDIYPFDQSMSEQSLDDLNQLLIQLGFLDQYRRPVTGAGFNLSKLDLVSNFILLQLKQQGFLQAKVVPLCQLKESSTTLTPPTPCDLSKLYGKTVERLSFKSEPGPRAEVAGLIIRGELLSQPSFLKQEVELTRGAALNAEALLLSQSNLRNLGLFKSLSIKPIGLGEAPAGAVSEPVTLVLNVEEKLPWLLDGYLGLRLSDQSLSGEAPKFKLLYTSALSVRHRNLFGKGWELGGGISHDNLIFDPLDIQSDYASWAVGPFFKNPRFLDTHIQLASELVYEQSLSSQRTAYLQRLRLASTLSYNFYQLSFPRRWGQGLRFDLTFESQLARQRLVSLSSERRTFGEISPTFTIRAALVYDQRDNPIHPTKGIYVTTAFDFLGGQSLSEGVISYRESLTMQWVSSWLKRRLIIAPTLKLGAIQSQLDDLEIAESISDFLFTAGGDGVSYPVRGYPVGVINTCSFPTTNPRCEKLSSGSPTQLNLLELAGRGLINLNLEARFPSFILSDLWLAGFFDLGGVSSSAFAWSWSYLFPSFGVGVRYLLPGQVPVRFDIAYPLRDTRFSQQTLSYHFNFFYSL